MPLRGFDEIQTTATPTRSAIIPPSIRTSIAVAICMSSAVLGAIAIRQNWGSVSSVASNVACPWFLAGSWLAGDFSREGWKRLNKSLATIYQEAKQGKLPNTPPLTRLMNSGGIIIAACWDCGLVRLVTNWRPWVPVRTGGRYQRFDGNSATLS